jgi:Fe2+ or Zn2+ uptake regulation protein
MSQVTGVSCPICSKGLLKIDALNKAGKSIESAELSVNMFGEVEFFGAEDLIGTDNEWQSTTAVCTKCGADFEVDSENSVIWPVSASNAEAKKYRIGKWVNI